MDWGGCWGVAIVTTFLLFPSSSWEIKAATSLISDCLMTPSAESQIIMDVSVRKANSQWCRTQSGMNMLSPVEASRSHVVARLGLVVAVGRNNGSTNVIPVSLFSVVKKDSKSRFDQSAPLANFLDDGMGLCGIWHILSHLSFDDADVSLSFIGASSCFEGNGGSLSWATRSSSRCLVLVVILFLTMASVERKTAA